MARALPTRRVPRHHPMPHGPAHQPFHRAHGAEAGPVRTSDLVLALLGVVLLGGLALVAAFALSAGATAP